MNVYQELVKGETICILFKSLFKKEQHTQDTEINESVIQREADNLEKRWIDIPAYIPAEPKEYQLVSIVRTAIAAGEFPESRFVIKKSQNEIQKQKKLPLLQPV